jgi:hypothetical protein
MNKRLIRDYEWMLLLMAAGGGVLWGMLSLFVGFSWRLVEAAGMLRVVLTVFTVPLYVAYWLGSALRLSVTDPSGVVIATGMILGLIPGVVCLGVLRYGGRE